MNPIVVFLVSVGIMVGVGVAILLAIMVCAAVWGADARGSDE